MIAATQEDIDRLSAIGSIVSRTLQFMKESVRPGITTLELDQMGEAFMNSLGARSAPRLMYNFPGATCICVNHETAHGIPGPRVLKDGDLINIDVSAEKDGYFSDSGASMVVGSVVPPKFERLLKAGRESLENALRVARAGERINLIGKAIEATATAAGYSVIRNLGSHGIGKKLHDEPSFIAGFYDKSDQRVLEENQVITIEPFVSTGATRVREFGDGWTLITKPHQRTVQFEHTIIVTKSDPIILT
ncbi:type I methionyl aminopeptidase [bacterium]|nr:type I methionyl aminopeptidase [bacterium]